MTNSEATGDAFGVTDAVGLVQLTPEQARVVGCLMEKQRTVPDTYPMTLKGLLSATNQSSSRFPVVTYDGALVQRCLDELKTLGLVRFVHPSHGERTTKFRQVLDEKQLLDEDEAAVVAVLLLRGAQTASELRTRCERLHPFPSAEAVERCLGALADRQPPLVRRLERRPGEREARWMHLFGDGERSPSAAAGTSSSPTVGPAGALDDLTARVAHLEALVGRLYELLGEEPSAASTQPEAPEAS